MIQRWTFDGPPAYPYENGGYVTYADHVAAVAAARIEWSMTNGPAFDFARGQSVGFEAGVKAARDAVDDDLDRYLAECDGAGIAAKDLVVVTFQRALAVIDAVTTRGKEGNRGD